MLEIIHGLGVIGIILCSAWLSYRFVSFILVFLFGKNYRMKVTLPDGSVQTERRLIRSRQELDQWMKEEKARRENGSIAS